MVASELVEIDDARRMVLEASAPLPAVALGLDDALGRVLAEDIVAERPLPEFDSSAMDGYAVRAADLTGAGADRPVALRVVGESRAGVPAPVAVATGEAIAISTGAMIPEGADAVVRVERTRPRNGTVDVLAAATAGEDLRRAGEDVAAHTMPLRRGTAVGPAELGVLAALGRDVVRCSAAPRLSVLVTGDELLAAGDPGRPGAVRDCNSYTIGALAQRAGALVLERTTVGDDLVRTRSSIAAAAARCDVLVVCGGVSVGAHDHVRAGLDHIGAHRCFWGLALKPGHPTWFGTLGRTLVFALPGNPVSAMVTFALLVAPALRAMQGEQQREPLSAALDGGYRKAAGRAHALRCRVTPREDGWHARITGPQGSHVLSSMLAADALAIVPSATCELAEGARVRIEALRDLGQPRPTASR